VPSKSEALEGENQICDRVVQGQGLALASG